MGSHKHKKKKKDHKLKRKKREVSLSSSDSGEPGMKWNIPSNDSDSDNSNEDRLTALVRESYKNHLLQALTKNFQTSNYFSDSNSVSAAVKQWSLALEQKMLKSCMRSTIYRTNMAVLINQVKNSTSDGKLFVERKKLSKMKSKFPVSKESQTVNSTPSKDVSDFGTQTDHLTSLLVLPLPNDLSPASKPYDPAIEFSDSQSSNGISNLNIKDSLVSSSPNQDICSITSTSDLVHHKQSSREYSLPNSHSNRRNSYNIDSFESNLDDEISKEIALIAGNQSIQVKPKVLEDKNKNKTSISSSVECKDNLDSRLTAMGLLNEFDNEADNLFSQVPSSKCKRNNWYAEEIAQSCNLTRILLKMSTSHRQRILKRFRELFGDSDENLAELSEKNISICRKRIASVVVKELTPIYQTKKIASRHLFKHVAKQITESLLDKSYAPDSKSIRRAVNDYFRYGKVPNERSKSRQN